MCVCVCVCVCKVAINKTSSVLFKAFFQRFSPVERYIGPIGVPIVAGLAAITSSCIISNKKVQIMCIGKQIIQVYSSFFSF